MAPGGGPAAGSGVSRQALSECHAGVLRPDRGPKGPGGAPAQARGRRHRRERHHREYLQEGLVLPEQAAPPEKGAGRKRCAFSIPVVDFRRYAARTPRRKPSTSRLSADELVV